MQQIIRTGLCTWLAFTFILIPAAFGQNLQAVSTKAASHLNRVERLLGRESPATVALLTERQTFVWPEDGVNWELEGRSIFTYNDIYRTEEVQYTWTGSDWAPLARRKFTGNEFNHVTATDQWDAGAGDYVPVDQTTYLYVYNLFTGRGLVEEELYKVWDGTRYVEQERTIYDIDESFQIAGYQTDSWTGSAWEPLENTSVLEEDDSVVFLTQTWDESGSVTLERTTFPHMSVQTLYDALRDLEALSADYEGYLYLLHLIPASVTEAWDGAEWVNVSKETVYLNLDGRPVYVDYEEWSGDAWVATARLNFVHSTGGTLNSLSWEEFAGEGWMEVLSEQYTWDEMGSLGSVWVRADFGEGMTTVHRQDFFWRHTGSSAEDDEVPTAFQLDPAYPNPFNPSTKFTYRIAESGTVAIRVFDSLGRDVATLVDGVQPAGSYDITFDAASLPSGIYLVRLETAHGQTVRPVTLVK